jgi:hypothetical protein
VAVTGDAYAKLVPGKPPILCAVIMVLDIV